VQITRNHFIYDFETNNSNIEVLWREKMNLLVEGKKYQPRGTNFLAN
jgi:hypothetical protein